MIIRQKGDYTLWGNGVHPTSCKSDKKYVLADKSKFVDFDDFKEADAEFCEMTGEKPLNDLFIKKS